MTDCKVILKLCLSSRIVFSTYCGTAVFIMNCCYQYDNSYSLAEPPKITTHPEELKDTVPGKPVSFTVDATGAEPLSYQWQWKPTGKKEEWRNLSSGGSLQGTDTPMLKFLSSESCSEGLYRCMVTNLVGAVPSNCADYIIGE